MKKSLGLVLAGICVLAAAGCGQGGPAAVQHVAAPAEKVLKVGTDPTFPPFEYYQQASGSYTGFDTELIQAVAQTMGYDRVEFVNVPFKDLLTGLNARQYDAVISCMSINDERKQQALFSDPYVESSYVVMAPAGYTGGSTEILKDAKIAVKSGTIAEEIAHTYTKYIIHCDSAEDAVRQVVGGSADFMLSDQYMAAYFLANGYGDQMEIVENVDLGVPSYLGIAVRPEDTNLHAGINAALTEYRWTTTYEQMKKSYFGDKV